MQRRLCPFTGQLAAELGGRRIGRALRMLVGARRVEPIRCERVTVGRLHPCSAAVRRCGSFLHFVCFLMLDRRAKFQYIDLLMETDSFFYQLLKQLPETLFALLGEPLTRVADYRFDALEVNWGTRSKSRLRPRIGPSLNCGRTASTMRSISLIRVRTAFTSIGFC
jgi:hypothetical protein